MAWEMRFTRSSVGVALLFLAVFAFIAPLTYQLTVLAIRLQSRVSAASRLESLHAQIEYVGGIDGGPIDFLAQSLMGPAACYDVVSVRASGPAIDDSAIAAISVFGELESLFLGDLDLGRNSARRLESLENVDRIHITDSQITIEALEVLRSRSQLTVVVLDGTPIEEEWLAALATSDSITDLSLNQTRIDDKGLRIVASMKQLTSLEVGGNAITDEGVHCLKMMERLQRLDIGRNSITDDSAQVLREITELEELNLSGTLIGDDGLFELGRNRCERKNHDGPDDLDDKERGLCNLYVLSVSQTNISDCGLMELRGLPRLISVFAEQTQATDFGAREFEQYSRARVTR